MTNRGSNTAPAATCTDGIQNGEETALDCGGGACGATCAQGQNCNSKYDCESLYCDPEAKRCGDAPKTGGNRFDSFQSSESAGGKDSMGTVIVIAVVALLAVSLVYAKSKGKDAPGRVTDAVMPATITVPAGGIRVPQVAALDHQAMINAARQVAEDARKRALAT